MPARSSPPDASRGPRSRRGAGVRGFIGRHRVAVAAAVVVPLLLLSAGLGYYYVRFSRLIDARLRGERVRAVPRVFARPFEVMPGDALSQRQMIDRLNDLGYANRPRLGAPGDFAIGRNAVALVPRAGSHEGQTVRILFSGSPESGSVREIVTVPPTGRVTRLTLEPPLITALEQQRQKRRIVSLDRLPRHMINAVLAIEDRRFYEHPGVDPIRIAGAVVTNLFGDKPYLEGASTITQQLARNFFLTEHLAVEQATGQRSLRRKLLEQFMSIVLEQRATKDEILELYLNDVYLGQRGSFAVHGVGEAARLFFGKDVSNVTLSEAAMIAGIIQTARHSPFQDPDRARARRNVVLRAMVDAGYITTDTAERAMREPIVVVARAVDAEAPYFVDYIGQILQERAPDATATNAGVDVHTTLDLHLQRVAQEAVRDGLASVDRVLARRRRGPAQAALLAADPRTGEILAMVGGRSYSQSQYNRAVNARRQPGSVFKPFVYLAAFERAKSEGRTDLTPASLVLDEPTPFAFGDEVYQPRNYDNEYDGEITFRRALALSRNVAAVKVAEAAGFDRVASLWRRVGQGTPARPYPSIALGVFEATPLEVATAYTLFANGGVVRPLHAIARIERDGRASVPAPAATRRVASEDTTFLVTNMMRSVLTEGTGAGARAAGFAADAAGKTGTTNDLRDAWFVGFTPELLAVVWVGLDDNRPLGLSGTQAALPIWTRFMKRALSGVRSTAFAVPDGIVFLEIDRDTGQLAMPACPRILREAFLAGQAPNTPCLLHAFYN